MVAEWRIYLNSQYAVEVQLMLKYFCPLLDNRTGSTTLQVMHVNKLEGVNVDVTVNTLLYVHSDETEGK